MLIGVTIFFTFMPCNIKIGVRIASKIYSIRQQDELFRHIYIDIDRYR